MITNRDAGLLRLAGKKGLLDPEKAKELIAALGEHGRADPLLREHGLTDAQIEELKEQQKNTSIPTEFDDYQIQGLVGKGGMSVVLKALHKPSQAHVAIKVLSPTMDELPTSRERFHREIRSVSKVQHPNIIRCYGSGETNNRPYLALEYMAKGDLATMVRKNGQAVPEQQALRITLDIAKGLCAIRDAEMIHRDLKPENIFLAFDGTAKLADLGLSKGADDEMGLTMVGKSVGTPAYMSPEQAQGRYDVNIRSDLFSLGSTLYYMLTGKLPFIGGNPQETMRKVVSDEPTEITTLRSDLMPGTVAILKGLMLKRADDRYQDPQHVVDDLQRLAQEGATFDPESVSISRRGRATRATVPASTAKTQRPATEPQVRTSQIVGGRKKPEETKGLFTKLFGWIWGR